MTLNSIYALCHLGKPQQQVKAVFELQAACLAGYLPDVSGCGVCGCQDAGFFCVRQGMLRCKGCLRPGDGLCLPVSAGTLAALRYICQADPRRAFGFQASDAVLRQLSGLAETYLTVQLEHSFSTLDFYHSICWNRPERAPAQKPAHT